MFAIVNLARDMTILNLIELVHVLLHLIPHLVDVDAPEYHLD